MVRAFRRFLTVTFLGTVILPPVTVVSSLHNLGQSLPNGVKLIAIFYGLLAVAGVAVFAAFLSKLEPSLSRASQEQGEFFDTLAVSFVPLAIASAAGLSLFLELALIRWQSSMFEFFAFYKNFGLLACFAGLGIGYSMARNREGVPLFLAIPLLAWQFLLLTFLRYGLAGGQSSSIQTVPFTEQLSMGLDAGHASQFVAIYLLLIVVFLLTVLAFLPIGQLCGRLMDRTGQLKAYGFNLFGSLMGVLLIFVISSFWTPPVIWFGLGFLVLIFFVVRSARSLLFAFVSVVLALTILAWPANPMWNRIYSPYQLLELSYGENGLLWMRAAGHYFQRVHNLSNAAVQASTDPKLRAIRNYYELPYRLTGDPGDVAIVGAGTGNDVAAALRSGARHVEAIEIDPAILKAGEDNHPERPYSDPRVHAVVNDARSFFRNSTGQFNVIAYGLLDSHTLLSHASSVRLDSFVYTVEGLREARAHLTENGVLSLSFAVIDQALGAKIYRMMQQAFDGKAPICIFADYDASVIFIQSKNGDLQLPRDVLAESGFAERSEFYRTWNLPVDLSTDDWPFLYMPRRIYPLSYLPMFALVILASIVLSRGFLDERPQISHLPFFFLGAAFMLVETKAITELGLVFGNTWQVIAVAIAGILTMSFISNAAVQRLRWRNSFVTHLFVLGALLAGWLVSKSGGLPSTALGRIGTAALLTCPVLFSGFIFSSLLSKESRVSSVMAVNLLGAMCGGILEYNSMYFGFRFLYLLAMGLYALSFISTLLRPKSVVTVAASSQMGIPPSQAPAD